VAGDALPATAVGHVVRLSVSDGGVPKRAVDALHVAYDGVVGDRQASRRHHGAPFQALCLWHAETIDQLAADGHPITYGDAGENVTISALDWPAVRPGVRLRMGSVLCEISSHAEPCSKNAQWFSDGNFSRIHDRNGPWSRMYATVIEPGGISVADTAVVEPVG
jgi:MOSC domain-containing protein YiiM